jgi:hypothetical protein
MPLPITCEPCSILRDAWTRQLRVLCCGGAGEPTALRSRPRLIIELAACKTLEIWGTGDPRRN